MPDLIVKVGGVDAAIAKLRKVNKAKDDKVRRVINTAALNVQRNAKKAAPVDTGRLRASIRPRFLQNGMAAEVFTDVEYAGYQEARSAYMFPAWEMERGPYLAALTSALKGAIAEAS